MKNILEELMNIQLRTIDSSNKTLLSYKEQIEQHKEQIVELEKKVCFWDGFCSACGKFEQILKHLESKVDEKSEEGEM